MFSVNAVKTSSGECNDSRKELNALNPKKESLPITVGGTSGESNIANLWKDNFGAIVYSVCSTDNRDQVIITVCVMTICPVPGHTDVINVHELRQIGRGLKNKKAVVCNDGIPLKSLSLDLGDC